MAWRFTSDQPVYLQIADRITKSVLSGEYPPGEQLPSVRQLAMEAAVNPNTVQHAFAELETMGILLSKGTQGRFVTEDKFVLEKSRKKMAEEIVRGFVKSMEQLGVSGEGIIHLVKENLS